MKPGRELDALVAEQVFDDHVEKRFGSEDTWYINNPMPLRSLPHYSTSIADAWLVVEKMTKAAWLPHIWVPHEPQLLYRVELVYDWAGESSKRAFSEADTAPHAICLAALRAVGVEVIHGTP